MNKKNTSTSIQYMVRIAVLVAIMLFLQATGLGLLQIGVVSIAIMIVPVLIGAITMGPAAGAILGAVFGAISFWTCFGRDPFGTTLMGINPVFTFLMCIPTRVVMGWLCGLIFKGLHKGLNAPAYVIASVCGALLNTTFFLGALILLFGQSEYILSLQGDMSIITFLVALVGMNGAIEAVFCSGVAASVSIALDKALNR